MKRSLIVDLCFLLIITVSTCGSAWAFKKLAVGQHIPPFTLVTVDGTERGSDSLWKPITIVTTLRSIDGMSAHVLSDLADISAGSSADSLAIWIAVLTKPDKNTVLRVPPALRECVLFDSDDRLDSILGFVVYPSTGVFSVSGELMAYFPLWRKTFQEELRRGILGSSDLSKDVAVDKAWYTTTARGQLLNEAKQLSAQGRYDSAAYILKRGVQSDTTWLEGTLALVDLLIRKANYAEVTRILDTWRAQSSDSPELKLALARVLYATGHADSALAMLAEGRVMSPNPEKFLGLEGEIFYQTRRFDSAVARWREAVELLLRRDNE